MKHQQGVTLGGLMFFMLLVGFGVYAAFRVVPAYIDQWTVQKIMQNVAGQSDVEGIKDRELRDRFAKELRLNNVKVVGVEDLSIERVAGGVRLTTEFSSKQPFMGAVNFCMDFKIVVDSTRP
jgi:hypothetical protein